MSKVIINASSVSPDVLLWLMRAKDGHYFIERKVNRYGTSINRFPISIEFAEKLQTMNINDAWIQMENSITGPY